MTPPKFGDFPIVAHDASFARGKVSNGGFVARRVASGRTTAWELTRRISPRDVVQVMVHDAYGGLEDNSYPRSYRLQPVPPSAPWFVRLADESGLFRLLCFDFDGKKSGVVVPELMDRAADDCASLAALLRELQISYVLCQSSGTGGRHLWIALSTGIPAGVVALLATAARANYSTLDHGMLHNPRTGGARPPLSPHRDGSSSRILDGALDTLHYPRTTPPDIENLTTALEDRVPAALPADTRPSGPIDPHYRPRRPLSAWGLGHMATIAGGSNPSWTGFMCLLAAATAGWSLAEVAHEAASAPGMEHYRSKNTTRGGRLPRRPAEATARLERQWATALHYHAVHSVVPKTSFASPSNTSADLTELAGIVAAIQTLLTRLQASPGRWGRSEVATSQRTILTAIAYLCLHTGKRTVAASIRDLAVISGLSRDTARRALSALAARGYLYQVTASEGGNAAEWCLPSPLSTPYGPVASQPLNNPRPPALLAARKILLDRVERELTDGRHDIFTRAGLGRLAGHVYALLGQHRLLSVERAAELTGTGIRHILTIFSRLHHHRLLVRRAGGWARSRQDFRDHAARTLQIAGILTDRAARYNAERQVWHWWQAEIITMTTHPSHRPRRPLATSRALLRNSSGTGERVWPRYPRGADQRGDHHIARQLVDEGALNPESRWQYLGDAA